MLIVSLFIGIALGVVYFLLGKKISAKAFDPSVKGGLFFVICCYFLRLGTVCYVSFYFVQNRARSDLYLMLVALVGSYLYLLAIETIKVLRTSSLKMSGNKR